MEPGRRLAVITTRGHTNDLFQVATLVRAATALEWQVDVFFRDDAVHRLTRAAIDAWEWSSVYDAVQSDLAQRLTAADFERMETFLRDAKTHGDFVTFAVDADSLQERGIAVDQLTSLVDGVATAEEFRVRAELAETVLTF
jgi:predicted peroxiredoxin